jgi:hypothetical protein
MSKPQNHTDPYKRHSNIDDISNLLARNIHLKIKNPEQGWGYRPPGPRRSEWHAQL